MPPRIASSSRTSEDEVRSRWEKPGQELLLLSCTPTLSPAGSKEVNEQEDGQAEAHEAESRNGFTWSELLEK